jgi:MraZ protein
MFRGVVHLNLDGKGRLAVPTKQREALSAPGNGKLILTADPSGCLLLYPQPDWEPIEQKLMSFSGLDERVRTLQRKLLGYAEELEMDGSGRILISASLRKLAQLEKTVVFVGQGRKFELWNDEKWDQQMSPTLSFRAGELPPELEGFSL